MQVLRVADMNLDGKRVLIREDFNVPMKDGAVTSDSRIVAALPTIRLALEKNAQVILLSHLGRPVEGEFDKNLSLAPVAGLLGKYLGFEVSFVQNYLEGVSSKARVVLCENTRFNKGEKKNDPELGKKYAALGDIFVMDAFATAHRIEASTNAVARFAPVACAGILLANELEALGRCFANPERPLAAILGGSKVSSKLLLLKSLSTKVDTLVVGGGIANNFIKAAGYEVGKSLYEPELLEDTLEIMSIAQKAGCQIPLPVDVVVSAELSPTSKGITKNISEVGKDDMILDIGAKTSAMYAEILNKSKAIIWNGPVGAFETTEFSKGTFAIAKAVAESSAFSVAGGGDTIAALQQSGFYKNISYISTGGGAFLEFLEGKTLPALLVLQERAKQ